MVTDEDMRFGIRMLLESFICSQKHAGMSHIALTSPYLVHFITDFVLQIVTCPFVAHPFHLSQP
jgi:hypothetical protein